MEREQTLQLIKNALKLYPDFPKKGVEFRDIHPILFDADIRNKTLRILEDLYKDKKIDIVVGLESRGYYFGLLLAQEWKLPFVPFRKAGKVLCISVYNFSSL
jgi:adenine phosphoribosyltransferase